MTIRSFAPAVFAVCFCVCAAASVDESNHTGAPDWPALAGVERVEVLTTDADGELRETVIWMAVYQGVAYLRTSGGSHWGDNIARDSDIVLRVEDEEYPLRATPVSDETLLAGVHATFREKYRWFDAVAGVIRGRNPRIMRLEPRE